MVQARYIHIYIVAIISLQISKKVYAPLQRVRNFNFMNLTEKQCQVVLTVIRHLNDSLDAHKIRKNADTCLL
jgi:hypothetical protein